MEQQFEVLAEQIVKYIGGKANISDITHCATRLRFRLRDEAAADTETLKGIQGVLMVRKSGGEYQLVIGTRVPWLYQEVLKITEKGN